MLTRSQCMQSSFNFKQNQTEEKYKLQIQNTNPKEVAESKIQIPGVFKEKEPIRTTDTIVQARLNFRYRYLILYCHSRR